MMYVLDRRSSPRQTEVHAPSAVQVRSATPFSEIEVAISAIARGEFVLEVDDEHRENEGDLIIAADSVTPEQMAFMVRHTTGIVCIALPGEVLDRLQLPPMVGNNQDARGTAFTVSVDCSHGISTGVSASDRVKTLLSLSQANSKAQDFVRPGHIFPLRAREGGVLERPGHTEAAFDLVRLAGRSPGGVLCELVKDGGEWRDVRISSSLPHCMAL